MPPSREGDRSEAVNRSVEAYEAAQSRDGLADLGDYLPPTDHPHYLAVLCELIRVDLEYGWERGSPDSVDRYRDRYPEVFRDERFVREILYEDERLRRQAGRTPSGGLPRDREVDGGGSADTPPRPSVALVPAGAPAVEVETLLMTRLRLLGPACAGVFAYFSLLVVLNPARKVGFSLEARGIVAFNWLALAACAALSVALWARRALSLRKLRAVEAALFGLVLAYLGWCFFTDLFVDRELLPPLREGDHALFHYASSWSLPFFALIVGYGTLIPSTFLRCALAVGAMAMLPLAIASAAGLAEGAITKSFVQSFLLQMALWMGAAAAIAVYGSHRLDGPPPPGIRGA